MTGSRPDTIGWLPLNSHHAAAFVHQLGIVAQNRGDYDQAERRYHQANAVDEELGDRVGAATSHSQLGAVHRAIGRLQEAVQWHCVALVARVAVRVPQARFDAQQLAELRTELGRRPFDVAASTALDADSLQNLHELLDYFKRQ